MGGRDQFSTSTELPAVWQAGRPSIYSFLRAQPQTGYEDVSLPDEPEDTEDEVRWAPGALDGVLGHHTAKPDESAGDLYRVFNIAARSLKKPDLQTLYDKLLDGEVLSIADDFVDLLIADPPEPADTVHMLATWLATQSPDRQPVKLGIILLGLLQSDQPPIDILMTLGRHDEFTLFAAVALGRISDNPEQTLWALARQVNGWGRIHLVERLARDPSPDLKAWLLREGYKNSVMYEYLAYDCAVAGGLVEALQQKHADPELLDGAADIISALIAGEPGPGFASYAGSAEAVGLFIDHIKRDGPNSSLERLLTLSRIQALLDIDPGDLDEWDRPHWTPTTSRKLRNAVDSAIAMAGWKPMVEAGFRSPDDMSFDKAARAAPVIGLDAWEPRFARQKASRDEGQWYWLMQTEDAGQAKRIIDLARAQIDLTQVASGPSDAIGFGPEFQSERALEMLFTGLDRFPGLGSDLVSAALTSRVTRVRNAAFRVVEAWGESAWTPDVTKALQNVAAADPYDELRLNAGKWLASRKLH